ncbi:hypothetical protein EYF80_063468 [Liparis tanakae]|uniref:Uncharacterized protein n=1 Tax=Liparis tanakae TaxID=230148 RepID=A0A4Z2ECD6_9TELE|nr:hypothetical protein EYF80_063468 [Liparis tanakae]
MSVNPLSWSWSWSCSVLTCRISRLLWIPSSAQRASTLWGPVHPEPSSSRLRTPWPPEAVSREGEADRTWRAPEAPEGCMEHTRPASEGLGLGDQVPEPGAAGGQPPGAGLPEEGLQLQRGLLIGLPLQGEGLQLQRGLLIGLPLQGEGRAAFRGSS